ncbi:SDR family oxidoreductase [Loigolactobacillus zhaoyuanensis]|uniref:SDR family oxidoreductase n=1 Tax=Loigolactobacillus zhaoyuanensis TaxID=2486017 RepID=UPI000F744543|nr:SDR family oxidoreductase [Loigolactobacillus zhaoyuanensis]
MNKRQPKENYLIDDSSKNVSPQPEIDHPTYRPAAKLKGKVAIITGGDSGIGAAVALLYAREGADIVIVHYESTDDAQKIKQKVEALGQRVLVCQGDIGDSAFAAQVVEQTLATFQQIDILVNNAGEQHVQEHVTAITDAQFERTFRTNIFGQFYLTKAALPHLKEHGAIINTTSVTAFKGNPLLLDYSSTKGAIVSWTRALAQNEELLKRDIRVNAVAPGPIWTPLIPATFPKAKLENWGETPMGRGGKAYELAPSYVFLAAVDSSFITGQIIHVNGGTFTG